MPCTRFGELCSEVWWPCPLGASPLCPGALGDVAPVGQAWEPAECPSSGVTSHEGTWVLGEVRGCGALLLATESCWGPSTAQRDGAKSLFWGDGELRTP